MYHVLGIGGREEAYYAGCLNMTLQAGPLTRLEGLLGPLGPFVQRIGHQLLKYHVRGTVAEPRFETETLGQDLLDVSRARDWRSRGGLLRRVFEYDTSGGPADTIGGTARTAGAVRAADRPSTAEVSRARDGRRTTIRDRDARTRSA